MSAAAARAAAARPGAALAAAAEVEQLAADAEPSLGAAVRSATDDYGRRIAEAAGRAVEEQRAALGPAVGSWGQSARLALGAIAAGGGIAFFIARDRLPIEDVWPWALACFALGVVLVVPEAFHTRRGAPLARRQTLPLQLVALLVVLGSVILALAQLLVGAAIGGALALVAIACAVRIEVVRAGDPIARERADGGPAALLRAVDEAAARLRGEALQRIAQAQRSVPRERSAAIAHDREAALRALVGTAALPVSEADRLVAAPLGTAILERFVDSTLRAHGLSAAQRAAGAARPS
ncbi:hypothetical protein LG314_11765 [Agrococcus terreus]|uniref:hypothetical protein n=1 Tax=Agrococcus terreus TaxID=574649 RepID=UPI00384AB318